MPYTHEIVRIERQSTKNSGSPMWRCTTSDGQTVNVFKHIDPNKDSFALMEEAGYASLIRMHLGDVQHWRQKNPIKVQLAKDGQWWKLTAVEPRAAGAEADPEFKPDYEMYKDRAERLASRLTFKNDLEIAYWDGETTGVQADDELVAVSVVDVRGYTAIDTLVQCAHPDKLLRPGKYGKCASEVNGITPDMLKTGVRTEEVLVPICNILNESVWVGWNIEFDIEVLERECLTYKHPLPYASGIHDAMRIFAEYMGDWDPAQQRFRPVTLGKAARLLGIDPGESHTARADALTTLEIMRAVAAGTPLTHIPF